MKKITDNFLKGLKATGARYEVYAGDGFIVKVTQIGRVSFWYRWRDGNNKHSVKLGNYPGMTLSKARKAHADLIDLRRAGDDIRTPQRGSDTVEELSQEYIKHHAKPKKQTWSEDQRMLDVDVLPLIGGKRAGDVRRRDIVGILDVIAERGSPRQSNTTRTLLMKMFKVGLQRSFPGIEFNPCSDIDRKQENPPRQRWLTKTEIKKFWNGMDTTRMSESTIRCLKLILVTGQRPGECLGIRQHEIDGNWWTIPAERTKNGIEQRVWLTKTAKQLIGEDDVPLPYPVEYRGLSSATRRLIDPKIKNNRLEIGHFTPHDLRRTAATHMAELGVVDFVIGQVLNHKEQTVTAVYNRYQYDKEKKAALIKWEKRLLEIIK